MSVRSCRGRDRATPTGSWPPRWSRCRRDMMPAADRVPGRYRRARAPRRPNTRRWRSVVGLPVASTAAEGPAAMRHVVRTLGDYADRLAAVIDPVPVRLADERMSTVVATRRLAERGVRGSVNGRSSTRRPRWRSCRAGWTRSGGRRDDRRAGLAFDEQAERGPAPRVGAARRKRASKGSGGKPPSRS